MIPAGTHRVAGHSQVADIHRVVDRILADHILVAGHSQVAGTHRIAGHILAVDCYKDLFEVVLGEYIHYTDLVDLGLDPG